MGTALQTPKGTSLYQFWGSQIAEHLNTRLSENKEPTIVNLASQEYFKVVDRKTLNARIVECVFEDYKGGKYKIISFFAKRARGLMARWVIERKARTPKALQSFNAEGYALDAGISTDNRLVFRRRLAD
jgi:cytoplasmic iron level regulating protein YaaA (DUF328/UPF0246 family)